MAAANDPDAVHGSVFRNEQRENHRPLNSGFLQRRRIVGLDKRLKFRFTVESRRRIRRRGGVDFHDSGIIDHACGTIGWRRTRLRKGDFSGEEQRRDGSDQGQNDLSVKMSG